MSELFDKAIATLAERVTESTHTFEFTNDNLYQYYIHILRKSRDIEGALKPDYHMAVFNAAFREWNIFIKEEEFAMTETNVLNTLNQVAPYQCNKMIFGVDIETMDTAACIRTVLRCEKEIEDIKGLPFKTKETNAYQKSLTVAMNECRKKVEIK